MNLTNTEIERYSKQIILKNIGFIGQKKLKKSKVLIIGLGGLGCPAAEYLSRAGIGTLGLIDKDKVSLSNIHRQTMFTTKDIKKYKVDVVKDRIKKINPHISIKSFKTNIDLRNINKIVKSFDIVLDGTDNFKSKFLINDISLDYKKFLVVGAISKFDGHIFTFDFKNKNNPSLRDFYQEEVVTDDILNCEYDGILGTVAGIVGTMQANEILRKILNIGQNLNGFILIIDLLNLNIRKVKLKKRV